MKTNVEMIMASKQSNFIANYSFFYNLKTFIFLFGSQTIQSNWSCYQISSLQTCGVTLFAISATIQKEALKKHYRYDNNPYHIALKFCVECLFNFLIASNQQQKITHIVVEQTTSDNFPIKLFFFS
jgi:hypothetical protein